MPSPELLITLTPDLPHFGQFVNDARLAGIRLNSATMELGELGDELKKIRAAGASLPFYFDAKGRQPRIAAVHPNKHHLEVDLTRPIEVETPVPVLFKAERDHALLERVEDGGQRLVFARGGPYYNVRPGESFHIRHPSYKIRGPHFIDEEQKKIELVRRAGFTRYFLSWVESREYIDAFRELVGRDAEVWLKIETPDGVRFVAEHWKKEPNLVLVAARGDLYVEIERPHTIGAALKLLIEKDPEACVASRILLSVVDSPVPSCADFLELEWLADIGYRRMMLCDDICVKEELLPVALNAFDAWRKDKCARAKKSASADCM